jgi:competence protein ComGC
VLPVTTKDKGIKQKNRFIIIIIIIITIIIIILFLAYFPYFEKMKIGLCDQGTVSVCVCASHISTSEK